MRRLILKDFLLRIEVQQDGCWFWIGPKTQQGYGWFGKRYAHRWAYEHFVRPIPPGQQIDHLCRHRGCVNPEHLEVVTNRENGHRGLSGALSPSKTSRYVGVRWDFRNRKWRTLIMLDRKHYHLGVFEDEEEAHQAYLDAEARYREHGTLPESIRDAKKTSQYPGVSWDTQRKKWQAVVQMNRKTHFIGRFDSEDEAYRAYMRRKDNTD